MLVCESWSRAETTQPLGNEQRIELMIEIPEGPVPEIALKPDVVMAMHADFEVVLSNDRGSVMLDVMDAKTGQQLKRSLWQFSSAPKNIFSGQGFTGLIYFNHPGTGSELQLLCRAEGTGKAEGKGAGQ